MLRAIYFIGGLGLLLVGAHVTISRTVGYQDPNALLILGLACCIALGSIGIGQCFADQRRVLGVFLVLALIAGEAYGLATTAERYVASREAAQAPFHDAEAKHAAAKDRLAAAEHSDAVTRAEAAKAKLDAEVIAKSAEKGCRENCRQVLEAQVRAATAAVASARADIQREIAAARAELQGSPLPASASPLADRLGWPAWMLDLIIAALASVACNGLAMGLIALGGHGPRRTGGGHVPVAGIGGATRVGQVVTGLPVGGKVLAPVAKPRLVSSQQPALGVIEFGAAELEAAPGGILDFDDFFRAYELAAEVSGKRALSPDEFLEPFKRLCGETGIRARKQGGRLLLLDVKLASPAPALIEHTADKRSPRRLGRMTKLPPAS